MYRWWFDILSTSANPPNPTWVAAHTNESDPASLANAVVDRRASEAHFYSIPPPPVPVSTFFMDRFTPFTSSDGFIESNLSTFADYHLALATANDPSFLPTSVLAPAFYDSHVPPEHPYVRASSAYSAVVQLYVRSSQLDTAAKRAKRFGDVTLMCRHGCSAIETWHHIFLDCPVFTDLRETAAFQLVTETCKVLEGIDVPDSTLQYVRDSANTIFRDSSVFWPQHESRYYMGLIPPIEDIITIPTCVPGVTRVRVVTRIAQTWHSMSIRLAGRIWGNHKRRVAPYNTARSKSVSYSLPDFLMHFA